ncbi:MAG TPA: LLM class flavin-dependent oxidoreductase [Ktedonobacter sp.]|jgi:alkanesulfonate monooxygenase SsuD/methylene tetrahydromethanopterin reductase-like flavin-dependent oxidoreductase (luciferase family)|nr:LLM class flavin-dependent oxidoreductase [Ktedonobacter sp.]
MQYGVNLPIIVDAQTLARLAVEAETAGWDGVFVWDCLTGNPENEPEKQAIYDPWIALAAIAMSTRRVRLGTMVTPLSRRRPWKVARETVTLDHLCQGRLILPVGLGSTTDGGFSKVGEQMDRKIRAEMLDEGLAVLAGLWSGHPFSSIGHHYQVQEMTFVPPPVQQPRIPIWVVGAWPRRKSLRRALQWDGILPTKMLDNGSFAEMTPADIQALKTFSEHHRPGGTPFDIVMEGETPGDDPVAATALLQPLAQAGVTWWIESVWATPETTGGVEGMFKRIHQGPPRIDHS